MMMLPLYFETRAGIYLLHAVMHIDHSEWAYNGLHKFESWKLKSLYQILQIQINYNIVDIF